MEPSLGYDCCGSLQWLPARVMSVLPRPMAYPAVVRPLPKLPLPLYLRPDTDGPPLHTLTRPSLLLTVTSIDYVFGQNVTEHPAQSPSPSSDRRRYFTVTYLC
jgi:hypothetical protein